MKLKGENANYKFKNSKSLGNVSLFEKTGNQQEKEKKQLCRLIMST